MEKQVPPPYQAGPPGFVPPPQPGVYPPGEYPPPPHGGPPPPHGGPVTVATVVVSATPTMYGPNPAHVTCPHCHASVTTSVEKSASTKTHLFAALLCLLGCWPCVCVPYCMDSCLEKKHTCPSCNAFLGSYT
ncbi:lipopolysaccharide-induced tumor necrosis factor-alpha factor homolog [Sitophilus oryzae]|uniref:Lipopolysaccharide-induced tumor necrosis factor-alpha factor homolog n=1 Tax=Sitophilus oryzae TaxID=7048 RepID=A0A6J2YS74_SITOR|nr:lipopolysaccharide-induced tumor necrosis factor-alpha factor homolog [Sitophilus oryzae]